uniref:Odorant-binding protein 24 n=1 Tax=Encarsia formosa TaxID=32400 RepID=A0A514TU07_ENCFO|nr:odorant-binding protein 24 [Encarsia formosa]
MRIFVSFLALCLVGVFAEDPIKDVNKDFVKACLVEQGFDPQLYPTGLRNAKVPEKQEQAKNCYYACMMKKMNLMKADGSLNEDALRQKFNLNLDTLGKALNTCKAQAKADTCKLAGCLMANRGA